MAKLAPFDEAEWQYTLKTLPLVMAGKRVKGWHKVRSKALPKSAEAAKFVRSRLHITQKEFAKTIGASLATVKAWESGARKPDGVASKLLQLLAKDKKLAARLASITL